MKKLFKGIIAIMVAAIMLSISVSAVSSHTGAYDTYTYSYENNAELLSAAGYIPVAIKQGSNMGIGDFSNLNDVYVDEKNNRLFLADTGNNRIVICDTEFENATEIKGYTYNGEYSDFNSPFGVYLDVNGYLYVADTANARVVRMTLDGNALDLFTCPDIKQFEGLEYKPKKVTVSAQGDIYIICDGVYEGIVTLDYEGEYQGFSGTNNVNPSAWDLFWYTYSSKEQKEAMSSFLPTTFLNLDVAEGEFIYAVSQYEDGLSSLVKKLNPGGKDILKNNSGQSILGDLGNLYYGRTTGRSNFSDICSLKNGMYACTDIKRGRIFLYNRDGEMIFAFSGMGNQIGNLKAPSAIDNLGFDLYVTDSTDNSITIWKPTDYGNCMLSGISAYDEGDIKAAEKYFSSAFQFNTNSEAAYLGLGKIQLRNNDWYGALASFRLANNKTYYSKALEKCRNEFINDNFTLIVGVILAFALLMVAGSLYKKYKKPVAEVTAKIGRLDRWADSTNYATFCVFHPFKGFDEMKREKRGSLSAAITVLLLFTVSSVISASMKGFLFGAGEINIFIEISKAVLPVLLFCLVNWGITTLFDGEGSMKYIFMASCYALWPLAILNIPLTALSNVLVLSEASIYYTILTTVYVITALLIIIGSMSVHNFSMTKTIFMLITTIFGMAVVVFILFLFFNLWYEVFTLIARIAREIKFRM